MAHLSISHDIPIKSQQKPPKTSGPAGPAPGSGLLRGADRSLQDLGREFGWFLGRFRQGDDGGTTFRCHLGPNFPRDFSQFCWMLMMLRGKSTIFAESGFQRCKKLGISLACEVRSIFHL